MPYITLDVEPNGIIRNLDADASIMPLAFLATGAQLIATQLISMIDSGIPQSAVYELGGDICSSIGKLIDQYKGA